MRRPTALIAMLLLGAAGCGPPGPAMADTAPCDQPMLTVENPTRYNIDVYTYSATSSRDELVGMVDAGSRRTFVLPPGSTGQLRIVRRNFNQQETEDEREVRMRTHCP